jgi:hypothetical protein
LSGSVVVAWFHLSSRSTMAPMLCCAMAPAPSPSESGHGMWHRRGRPPRRSYRNQAGLVFRPTGLSTFPSGEMVPESFSYLASRFLHAWDRQRHHRCHRRSICPTRYSSHQWPLPQRLDLWPLFLPAKARARGEPCGHLPTPLADGQTSRVYSSNPAQYLYISCYGCNCQ